MDASSSWETMYGDEKYRWFWPPAYDPQASPPEVDSVISLLQAEPGSRLLDLACGLGWLTICLAQRGFQVTGFDLSPELLRRAEQAADQAAVEVRWLRGDMRHLPGQWSRSFDYVTLTLSEFGCFSDESDNQRVLEEVARVLTVGGRFLLDLVVNRDGLVHQGWERDFLPGDGFIVSQEATFDLVSGIHQRVFNWHQLGQSHQLKWQIRAYSPPEVARMLRQAGFQVSAVFGNLDGDKLAPDSMGMTFVAQKNP